MERIEKIIHSKIFKHTFSIVFVIAMLGWAGFRFATIASENKREVFNISRVYANQGIPVETLIITTKTGTLFEPLSIKDNRAYVSATRAKGLNAGQRVANGKIKSVSRRIDLNTGMYLVRTENVDDGLQSAEFVAKGHFVPLYAISNNQVYVVKNGIAQKRNIVIERQDSENAFVTDGLNDGDVVILSTVSAGDKVKVIK